MRPKLYRRWLSPGAILAVLVLAAGCDRTPAEPVTAASPVQPKPVATPVSVPQPELTALPAATGPIAFRDATPETGIDFRHTDGHTGQYYIVEANASGMATFDFDRDGLMDIYFLNGTPLRGASPDDPPGGNALYRNLGGFRFADVTQAAGVGSAGYGQGVAVADYNNDGHQDLYVCNFGPKVLYRNNGDGTFADVTQGAGLANGDRFGRE